MLGPFHQARSATLNFEKVCSFGRARRATLWRKRLNRRFTFGGGGVRELVVLNAPTAPVKLRCSARSTMPSPTSRWTRTSGHAGTGDFHPSVTRTRWRCENQPPRAPSRPHVRIGVIFSGREIDKRAEKQVSGSPLPTPTLPHAGDVRDPDEIGLRQNPVWPQECTTRK